MIPRNARKVLDLCCCPGGKFLALADMMAADSILVGVDVNMRRMNVAKSLVKQSLSHVATTNFKQFQQMPRLLLFIEDGTKFGPLCIGDLKFDSKVFAEEIALRGKRKRSNKSSRHRESKELIESLYEITHSNNYSNNSDENAKESISFFDLFDAVLVDAECSHDASYHHLRFTSEIPSLLSKEICNNLQEDDDVLSVDDEHKDDLKMKPFAREKYMYNCQSEEGQNNLEELQRSLILNGFHRTRPGGVLVFSTCSAIERQGEAIVRWLLQQRDDAEIFPVSNEEGPALWLGEENTEKWRMFVHENMIRSAGIGAGLDAKNSIDENPSSSVSDSYCKRVSLEQATPPLQRDTTLPGTVRLSSSGGVSGMFVARIRKKDINT